MLCWVFDIEDRDVVKDYGDYLLNCVNKYNFCVKCDLSFQN